MSNHPCKFGAACNRPNCKFVHPDEEEEQSFSSQLYYSDSYQQDPPLGYPPHYPTGYPPQYPPGYPPQYPPGYPPQYTVYYPPHIYYPPQRQLSNRAPIGFDVNQSNISSVPRTPPRITVHELKKNLVSNVNELCKYVANTEITVHRLEEGKKSYQVPPHSDVNNIKYKLPVDLRDQTTDNTKVINFWDTNIIFDLINKREYAVGLANDLANTNLMTETAQREVRVSDNYFRSQKQRLQCYSTILSLSRMEMICDCVQDALGIKEPTVNTKNDIQIWIEACLVASCHNDRQWMFNLLSWNHFLVQDIATLVLGGKFSLEQFGIDVLVPICRPPASPSEHTPEFIAKLEQLRKSYPLHL